MKESIYLNKNRELILTKNLCIIPSHKDINEYKISINKKYIIVSGKLEMAIRTNINFSYIFSKYGTLLRIGLKQKEFEEIAKDGRTYALMCDTSKWLYEIFKSANNK